MLKRISKKMIENRKNLIVDLTKKSWLNVWLTGSDEVKEAIEKIVLIERAKAQDK